MKCTHGPKAGQEAVAQGQGIGMTTTVGGTTEGEVVVGAGTGMIVTGIVEGKGIIVTEAGAAVSALTTTKAVVETGRMMSEEAGASHLRVRPLYGVVRPLFGVVLVPGVHLPADRHLPAMKVLKGAAPMSDLHVLSVLHLVLAGWILEVHPLLILIEMTDEVLEFLVWRCLRHMRICFLWMVYSDVALSIIRVLMLVLDLQ